MYYVLSIHDTNIFYSITLSKESLKNKIRETRVHDNFFKKKWLNIKKSLPGHNNQADNQDPKHGSSHSGKENVN